jgi:hypothetical protein
LGEELTPSTGEEACFVFGESGAREWVDDCDEVEVDKADEAEEEDEEVDTSIEVEVEVAGVSPCSTASGEWEEPAVDAGEQLRVSGASRIRQFQRERDQEKERKNGLWRERESEEGPQRSKSEKQKEVGRRRRAKKEEKQNCVHANTNRYTYQPQGDSAWLNSVYYGVCSFVSST